MNNTVWVFFVIYAILFSITLCVTLISVATNKKILVLRPTDWLELTIGSVSIGFFLGYVNSMVLNKNNGDTMFVIVAFMFFSWYLLTRFLTNVVYNPK